MYTGIFERMQTPILPLLFDNLDFRFDDAFFGFLIVVTSFRHSYMLVLGALPVGPNLPRQWVTVLQNTEWLQHMPKTYGPIIPVSPNPTKQQVTIVALIIRIGFGCQSFYNYKL